MYACMHACLPTCLPACMHAWMHACMHACVYNKYIYIYVYTCVCIARPFGIASIGHNTLSHYLLKLDSQVSAFWLRNVDAAILGPNPTQFSPHFQGVVASTVTSNVYHSNGECLCICGTLGSETAIRFPMFFLSGLQIKCNIGKPFVCWASRTPLQLLLWVRPLVPFLNLPKNEHMTLECPPSQLLDLDAPWI